MSFGNIFGPDAKMLNPTGNINAPKSFGRNLIESIYNRFPVFFFGALTDQINPVVDTTLYCPLKYNIERKIVTTTDAVTEIDFRPITSKHWIVTHAFVSGILGVNNLVRTQIIHKNGTVGIVVAQHDTTFNANIFPIGGMSSGWEATENVWMTQQGIDPVYLSSEDTLRFIVIESVFGAAEVQAAINYLELPENQPFGPIFGK